MCGADKVTSDSNHFSLYSTVLTRFIFVVSALEEVYRFVDGYYNSSADAEHIPEKSRPRSSSIKAAILIDTIPRDSWPKHLVHLVQNYKSVFSRYMKDHRGDLSGMQFADEEMPSYALHLIRNLRNHVAHGVFPIIPNPDYSFGIDGERDKLLQLLNRSCRLSAVYIQMLMQTFNTGFMSEEYQSCVEASGRAFKHFVAHCNVGYIGVLHLKGNFSLADAFDYDLQVENGAE